MPPRRCPIGNTVGAVGRAVEAAAGRPAWAGCTWRQPPAHVVACGLSGFPRRGCSRRSVVSLESNDDFLLFPIRAVPVGLFSELDGLELPQPSL